LVFSDFRWLAVAFAKAALSRTHFRPLPSPSENFARRGKKFFEIVETVESLSGETRSADRPSRRAKRVKRLQRGRPQIRLRATLRRDRWRGYHGYGERSLAGDWFRAKHWVPRRSDRINKM